MNTSRISIRSYLVGFVMSVALTLAAYLVVVNHSFTQNGLIGAIITLAFIQCIVQLVLFLHIGSETRPRWKLFIFFTTVIGIGILVGGSIWIMNHLNYNMTPQDMSSYLLKDEGIQP
jgi:cytochrome o ubiquinol oxidase operon protein cyoD